MKILLVVEAALGGSGRHVLDLAEGLLARGNQVHLLYSPLRADRAFVAGVAALSATRSGFHLHSVPIERKLGFSDFRSYWELSRYVRANGPFDVIHAHSTKAGFLARLLLNRGSARVLYTPHGLMTLDPALRGIRRRAVCFLESGLSWLCSSVIVVSNVERRCALATGISNSKLIEIPNGFDACVSKRDAIRADYGLSSDTVCIGWVGRLTECKAPGRMLEAFASLKQSTKIPVHLIVVGWGPLEGRLREQAEQLHIADYVTFAGEADGPSHITAIDVLAHTSTVEAFAYVFLEAISAAVPVVTTRVGGTEYLVTDGVTGYTCDPWNRDVFARGLQRLVENPELRAAMGVSARLRSAEFTVDAMVNATAEAYRVRESPNPAMHHSVAASGNRP